MFVGWELAVFAENVLGKLATTRLQNSIQVGFLNSLGFGTEGMDGGIQVFWGIAFYRCGGR